MIKNILYVALGGGIGAALRYLVIILAKPQTFPYATLAINITGSFILGLIIAFGIKHESLDEQLKLFLATGICGGFTTFSSFSAENILLMQEGKYDLAFTYILISVVAGILATWLGFKLIQQ